MNRRLVFAIVLFIAIGLDMLSTHIMIASGYKELTGIVLLMARFGYIGLFVWATLWAVTFYVLHPKLTKWKLNVHAETIATFMSIASLLAFIGNSYLYYTEAIM